MICKIYRSWTLRGREWRWTVYATNGLKIANSGESYKSRQHCISMAKTILHPSIVIHIEGELG